MLIQQNEPRHRASSTLCGKKQEYRGDVIIYLPAVCSLPSWPVIDRTSPSWPVSGTELHPDKEASSLQAFDNGKTFARGLCLLFWILAVILEGCIDCWSLSLSPYPRGSSTSSVVEAEKKRGVDFFFFCLSVKKLWSSCWFLKYLGVCCVRPKKRF